jgi:hypothetical protein
MFPEDGLSPNVGVFHLSRVLIFRINISGCTWKLFPGLAKPARPRGTPAKLHRSASFSTLDTPAAPEPALAIHR